MSQEFEVATVRALSNAVEEEVTLDVRDLSFIGFAGNRPVLEIGSVKKIRLKLFTASDYGLKPVGRDEQAGLERVSNGFGYRMIGTLADQGLIVGETIFHDETLSEDFEYLVGETVALTVDRIDVRFLRD